MIIKHLSTALVTTAILVGSSISANAESVTLVAHDGSAEITGELISFVDDVYTISTLLGSVQMSASQVTCIGEYCPTQIENPEGEPQS